MRVAGAAGVRAVVATVVLLAVAACGGGDGASDDAGGGARPRTDARLAILQPTANQLTGPDVTLQLDLIGAQVVDRTTGPLSPTEGHIHVTVDGKLVSMAYGTSQELEALPPGQHTIQAEFVATDHVPFANRVVAAQLFTVQ